MPFPASFSQLQTLLAVPFLAVMLTFPASAEPTPTGSPPQAESSAPTGENGTNAPSAPHDATEPDAAADDPDGTPDDNDAATAPAAADKPKSTILIDIDKSTQEMTVFVDGVQQYSWPVSTGMRGHSTPSGTYTASSMNEMWYSKQWDNAPMPHAIFFTKQGHAIHGTMDEKRLGNAASHGCVRLSRANATTLFTLVKATGLENTQVVLTGTTKGGEGPKIASPSRGGDGYIYPPWFERGDGYQQAQPRKRRGLFGRRWFQDDGPQGYYVPRNGYSYRRGY